MYVVLHSTTCIDWIGRNLLFETLGVNAASPPDEYNNTLTVQNVVVLAVHTTCIRFDDDPKTK